MERELGFEPVVCSPAVPVSEAGRCRCPRPAAGSDGGRTPVVTEAGWPR